MSLFLHRVILFTYVSALVVNVLHFIECTTACIAYRFAHTQERVVVFARVASSPKDHYWYEIAWLSSVDHSRGSCEHFVSRQLHRLAAQVDKPSFYPTFLLFAISRSYVHMYVPTAVADVALLPHSTKVSWSSSTCPPRNMREFYVHALKLSYFSVIVMRCRDVTNKQLTHFHRKLSEGKYRLLEMRVIRVTKLLAEL